MMDEIAGGLKKLLIEDLTNICLSLGESNNSLKVREVHASSWHQKSTKDIWQRNIKYSIMLKK